MTVSFDGRFYFDLIHTLGQTMKREKYKTEDSYTKHGKSKNDKQV